MTAQLDHVNGAAVPRFDPVALAEAEAIRTKAEAEADALRVKAEGDAKASELVAVQEAEKQRLQNERTALRVEAEKAAHDERMAKLAASKAEAEAARDKALKAAADQAEEQATRAAEERRSELTWKWAARSIYLVSLFIALPLQLKAFYSDDKPFMMAAPILLEGLALVLAFGAAWAVAHRRDVAPYRVGVMISAAVAACVNVWHGNADPTIGIEAGVVGALASIGGPIVLMAYEQGVAQKRDGIPSWRDRRAAQKVEEAERAEAQRKAAEKKRADVDRHTEKLEAEMAAAAEQKRKDADRQKAHTEVWAVAESMRSARGLPFVTEAIWSEAWYRVTGSKHVGITPEIESSSKAAAARMKSASEMPILGDFAQVESQKAPRLEGVDGRRSNGGTPPRRVAGDTLPNSPAARKQAAIEQTTRKASVEEQS